MKRLILSGLTATALSLAGCSGLQSTSNDLKSQVVSVAPDAGFIQHPERQTARADLPFQKVWIRPGFDAVAYRELVVAPVNTQYMLQMDWFDRQSMANWIGDFNRDVRELGEYFHDQVVADFKRDPQRRFVVVERAGQHDPGKRTLRLELALIEVIPSKSLLHAAGWLQMGAGTAAGLINQRSAAFEGRLRDLTTGEVVATFADRDKQDVDPLDLSRLTWYGPAKQIMDRWSEQFVQIANRKPGEAVTDPVSFSLRPF